MRFDLLGARIRERTVPAGVGVDLGAIQTDAAKTGELILPRNLEHRYEGGFEFLAKTTPEARPGVVIGMPVTRGIAECQ